MIPLPSKSWSSRRSNFWKSLTMLFFCTAVQRKGLLKEQVITLYLSLNLASWSVPASQCKLPHTPVHQAPPGWRCQQHQDTARAQPLENSHLTAHPTALPRCVLTLSNTLLPFSSALLCSVQMRGSLQLLQSSSASLAARNRACGIPCTGSYAGNSGVTPLREKGSRAQKEGARMQILGQSDMKDKNSLAKDMKWHGGNTTMQYSTHNCAGCRISDITVKWSKLHQGKKPIK